MMNENENVDDNVDVNENDNKKLDTLHPKHYTLNTTHYTKKK